MDQRDAIKRSIQFKEQLDAQHRNPAGLSYGDSVKAGWIVVAGVIGGVACVVLLGLAVVSLFT